MDYQSMRLEMVREQIEKRGIVDKKVLDAMKEVPREIFVPAPLKSSAYDDNPLPIGNGQTISQPFIVAEMTELLNLKPDDKVLEIGTGSGYQAAILSKLAKKVITVERVKELALKTKKLLQKQGYANVEVVFGDGTKGYAKEAPYDAIIITAASEQVPEKLIEQLAENGRLIAPIGPGYGQELLRIWKKNGKLVKDFHGGVMFVPLIGED